MNQPNETFVPLIEVDFSSQVLAADGPVLVYFWAQWCLPCRLVDSLLSRLPLDALTDTKTFRMNVDSTPNLVQRYQLKTIPCFALFSKGNLLAMKEGVCSRQQLIDLLDIGKADSSMHSKE